MLTCTRIRILLSRAANTRCPDTDAYSCPGSRWTLRLELGICVCYKPTAIDARNNWWGWNSSYFVRGRVWDQNDDKYLIPVNWDPYLQTNKSLIAGALSFPHTRATCLRVGVSLLQRVGDC